MVGSSGRHTQVLLQAAPVKETPQARLKRLMAAKLNKQVASDAVRIAQSKVAEERERQSRLRLEQKHLSRRSPSPERGRSVVVQRPVLLEPTRLAGLHRTQGREKRLVTGSQCSLKGGGSIQMQDEQTHGVYSPHV